MNEIELINQKIRDLQNQKLAAKQDIFEPYRVNQIDGEIDRLIKRRDWYLNTIDNLLALYPQTIQDGNDTYNRRDWIKRYDNHGLDQKLSLMRNELQSRFHVNVNFDLTYIDQDEKAKQIEAAQERQALADVLQDVFKASDKYCKEHPSNETQDTHFYSRYLWNKQGYELTRSNVESFINTLKRQNLLPATSFIGKTMQAIGENLNRA